MKKLVQIVFVCLALITVSCSNDDGEPAAGNNEFQGDWSGTFSGDNSGTWTVDISPTGVVTGTAVGLSVNGNITNQGAFTATVGDVEGGTTFIGLFSGNSASGTWENISLDETGVWSGNRD